MTVGGGGPSGQAGAARSILSSFSYSPNSTVTVYRYAIAMALRSFVDKRTVDEMKLVGLLVLTALERGLPSSVCAASFVQR